MSRWRNIVDALRGVDTAGTAASSLATARALRDDVRGLRGIAGEATRHLAAAQLQLEQLSAARMDDQAAGAHLDRLAAVLDLARVTAHVRAAVDRSVVVDAPFPHIVVSGLLPPDLYAEAVAAVPADLFFRVVDEGGPELIVPPKIASLHATALWTFMTALAEDALVPALNERLHGTASPALVVSRPRLVRTSAGMRWHADPADRLIVLMPLVAGRDATPDQPVAVAFSASGGGPGALPPLPAFATGTLDTVFDVRARALMRAED